MYVRGDGRKRDRLRVVLATQNPGKVREIGSILGPLAIEVLTLKDFPTAGAANEDGTTFEENAVKKALHVWRSTGLVSIADDSGLEVQALDGRPGIYSARFAGEHASYEENNRKLLGLLRDIPFERRRATFVCVAALVGPDGRVILKRGEVAGFITDRPAGAGGFGYDPIFYLPDYGKTMAELSEDVKNTISHRAQAFSGIRQVLEAMLGSSPTP